MNNSLRLVLAFFAAYGFNTALHECAHGLMAHLLGLPATVFQFYANIDYRGADSRERVLRVYKDLCKRSPRDMF